MELKTSNQLKIETAWSVAVIEFRTIDNKAIVWINSKHSDYMITVMFPNLRAGMTPSSKIFVIQKTLEYLKMTDRFHLDHSEYIEDDPN